MWLFLNASDFMVVFLNQRVFKGQESKSEVPSPSKWPTAGILGPDLVKLHREEVKGLRDKNES